jgi:hypothetical protein
MVKRKLGQREIEDGHRDGERSPCKFLAHNLVCLIHEQEELGIEPVFWTESACKALAVS